MFNWSIPAAMLCGCFLIGTAEAGRMDAYKEILESRRYTIRYQDKTLQYLRKGSAHSRKKGNSFFGAGLLGYGYYSHASPYYDVGSGYVVSDGNARYLKYNKRLAGNSFTKEGYTDDKGNMIYKTQWQGYITDGGDDYGGTISYILNSFLGKGKYKAREVNSGQFDDGLYYEDYRVDVDNDKVFSVYRFYFAGDRLVKAVFADYYYNKKGELDGSQYFIMFDEFLPAPDEEGIKKLSKYKK